jgi:hypothetical protein
MELFIVEGVKKERRGKYLNLKGRKELIGRDRYLNNKIF